MGLKQLPIPMPTHESLLLTLMAIKRGTRQRNNSYIVYLFVIEPHLRKGQRFLERTNDNEKWHLFSTTGSQIRPIEANVVLVTLRKHSLKTRTISKSDFNNKFRNEANILLVATFIFFFLRNRYYHSNNSTRVMTTLYPNKPTLRTFTWDFLAGYVNFPSFFPLYAILSIENSPPFVYLLRYILIPTRSKVILSSSLVC